MARDSILDEAEKNEAESEPEQGSETATAEDESTSDGEDDGDTERVRLTQRMTPELADKVDAVQDRYQLPSRNATINFILTEGIDTLLGSRDNDR